MRRQAWVLGALLISGGHVAHGGIAMAHEEVKATDKVVKSDAEWKKQLTTLQYHVLREKGTEPAFTGNYWNDHQHAVYRCAGCGLILFRSDDKFDSGTGWPSFTRPATPGSVAEEK